MAGATMQRPDARAAARSALVRLLAVLREDLLAPAALAEVRAEVRRLLREHARAVKQTAGKPAKRRLQRQQQIAPAAGALQRIPDVLARYRAQVMDLQRVLTEGIDPADLARTRALLAEMLGTVTIGRDAETGENYADLEEPAERLLFAAVGESLGMVAGARNASRRRLVIGYRVSP